MALAVFAIFLFAYFLAAAPRTAGRPVRRWRSRIAGIALWGGAARHHRLTGRVRARRHPRRIGTRVGPLLRRGVML